jgi:sigma54-dependent transcription regulator
MEDQMPKYVVQGTFPDGLRVPVGNGGAVLCRRVVERKRARRRDVDQLIRE